MEAKAENGSQKVGEKIKGYRIEQNLTLKDLSEKTNLSASYLSLLERGQTSVTLVSMQNIAKALNVSPSVFLDEPPPVEGHIVREHEQRVFKLKDDDSSIFYSLAVAAPDETFRMSPTIKVLFPENEDSMVSMYTHEHEELGYVLEGVLTLYLNDQECQLYPGDFFHFYSTQPHCLANYSNKLVKIFYVTLPLPNGDAI